MSREKKLADFISRVQGNVIVSCQATVEEALFGADIMAKMALSAVRGGAGGIRANSPADVSAIRKTVDVPIIGIYKVHFPGTPVIITATVGHALEIAEAGADMIAVDCTFRPQQKGPDLELVRIISETLDIPVFAEGRYHTPEEVRQALDYGATAVIVGGAVTRPKEITERFVEAIRGE